MARISDDVGRAWETAVTNKLKVLHQIGVVAWWEHGQPQVAWLPHLRAWKKTGDSGADVSGVLSGNGRAFAAEIKSVGSRDGRAPVLVREDAMRPRQVEHLDAVARAGGLALLAVQFRGEGSPWLNSVIPWAEVPWEKARVKHHVVAGDCERWRIPTGRHLFEHLIEPPKKDQLAKI